MQRDLVVAARNGDLDACSQLMRASFPRPYGVANLIAPDDSSLTLDPGKEVCEDEAG